jgi:hypothetical protein
MMSTRRRWRRVSYLAEEAMSSKDQIERIAKRRREIGKRIADAPEKFKICNGCQSLNPTTNTFCSFCRSYGFESNREAVLAMAQFLGDRPLGLSCGVLPRVTTSHAFEEA